MSCNVCLFVSGVAARSLIEIIVSFVLMFVFLFAEQSHGKSDWQRRHC